MFTNSFCASGKSHLHSQKCDGELSNKAGSAFINVFSWLHDHLAQLVQSQLKGARIYCLTVPHKICRTSLCRSTEIIYRA